MSIVSISEDIFKSLLKLAKNGAEKALDDIKALEDSFTASKTAVAPTSTIDTTTPPPVDQVSTGASVNDSTANPQE